MKRNIRLILLGELILLAVILCLVILFTGMGPKVLLWLIDIPALLITLLVLIPGLLIAREWKDFAKAFSVGIKHYSLLELKNIIGAVKTAQTMTAFGIVFSIIVSAILLMGRLSEPSTVGNSLSLIVHTGLYGIIVEYLLFPLKLNAERKMNEEMDIGDE